MMRAEKCSCVAPRRRASLRPSAGGDVLVHLTSTSRRRLRGIIRWTRPVVMFSAALLTGCAHAPAGRGSPEDLREAEELAREVVAAERSIRPDTLPPTAVAVAPLRVIGNDPSLIPLGYGLADFVMADLARSPQLIVVNRLRLDAVLREIDMAQSGRVDTTSAPRIGRLIGAGRLVTGTLTQRAGGNIGIGTHIVRTTTGEQRLVVAADASLDQILRAQKELTFRIFTELGVTLTPAERASIEPFQTQNLSALMAYSRGVQYETEGRFAAAAREFRRAAQLDPAFAMAGQRAASARLLSSSSPLNRALALTSDRLNPSVVQFNSVDRSGPTDPSFPANTVTIRVTIITP